MKIFIKVFVLIGLTVGIAIGGFFFYKASMADVTFKDTTIELSIDGLHFLLIGEDGTTFQAASKDFFLLRKISGETIVPVPEKPPLGWIFDTYYFAAPREIPGGKWLVSEGNPTVEITSKAPVEVKFLWTESSKDSMEFLISILGFTIWVLVLLILKLLHFYTW